MDIEYKWSRYIRKEKCKSSENIKLVSPFYREDHNEPVDLSSPSW
ncbi:hypothetical protein D4764_14G0003340 [Takifugu flavidus]|uniref:Uncharacterized protein n=1 Tax=Takifugu flavidus TaxID=433684 RepID=A0A5C6P417_9TELE|nr:hypothetical protein D4764_14G0003340 [Takifugu flavidus]